MSSANGYTLEVKTRDGHKFQLVATWPAPYFVYVEQGEGPNGKEPPPERRQRNTRRLQPQPYGIALGVMRLSWPAPQMVVGPETER